MWLWRLLYNGFIEVLHQVKKNKFKIIHIKEHSLKTIIWSTYSHIYPKVDRRKQTGLWNKITRLRFSPGGPSTKIEAYTIKMLSIFYFSSRCLYCTYMELITFVLVLRKLNFWNHSPSINRETYSYPVSHPSTRNQTLFTLCSVIRMVSGVTVFILVYWRVSANLIWE